MYSVLFTFGSYANGNGIRTCQNIRVEAGDADAAEQIDVSYGTCFFF